MTTSLRGGQLLIKSLLKWSKSIFFDSNECYCLMKGLMNYIYKIILFILIIVWNLLFNRDVPLVKAINYKNQNQTVMGWRNLYRISMRSVMMTVKVTQYSSSHNSITLLTSWAYVVSSSQIVCQAKFHNVFLRYFKWLNTFCAKFRFDFRMCCVAVFFHLMPRPFFLLSFMTFYRSTCSFLSVFTMKMVSFAYQMLRFFPPIKNSGRTFRFVRFVLL